MNHLRALFYAGQVDFETFTPLQKQLHVAWHAAIARFAMDAILAIGAIIIELGFDAFDHLLADNIV